MLRGLRRTRLAPLLSLLTLACVVSLSASSLLHSDADDTICNPVLVQDQVPDHGAFESLGADGGSPRSQPEHCAVCHWSSLRTVAAQLLTSAPAEEGFHLSSTAVLPFRSAILSRQPARAPPFA
jgi:hypothetical protein